MQQNSNNFLMRPLALFVLLATQGSAAFAAVNLAITPAAPLPTSISPGGTVTVNFTVTNKTSKPQNGYSLEGMPNTVVQTTGVNDCPLKINLASQQHCNLALTISGPVHSFVALCSGSSCSTSSVPLDISEGGNSPNVLLAPGFYGSNTIEAFSLLMALKTGTSAWSYPINDTPSTAPTDIGPSESNMLNAATCNEDQSLCIAGGTYLGVPLYRGLVAPTGIIYPLIAMSIDQGTTWTYPVSSTFAPSNLRNSIENQILSVSCTGPLCIGTGTVGVDLTSITTTAEANFIPLIAQTTDGGANWSFPTLPDGTDLASPTAIATLKGSTCVAGVSDSTCYAAGAYETNSYDSYFIIYQTTNSGTSWQNIFDVATPVASPTNFANDGVFNAISCNTEVCVAVGTYATAVTRTGFVPFLSQNTGLNHSWEYIIEDGSGQPADQQISTDLTESEFFSVSCSENACIAVGDYWNGNATVPMIAQSANNGQSWSYGVTTTINPAPGLSTSVGLSRFNSASCSDTICVAGGFYDSNNQQALMLAQSTDQGATWTYPISVNNQPADIDGSKSSSINSVSCQANVCIATGTYTSGAPLLAKGTTNLFIAETDDGGNTWTFQVTSAGPLPPDFQFGVFNGSYASTTYLPKWAQVLQQ